MKIRTARVLPPGLLVLHLLIALYLVSLMWMRYQQATEERHHQRAITDHEHEQTEALRRRVESLEAIKAGLLADDPYVVEMMARSLHGYRAQGDISPPPLSAP